MNLDFANSLRLGTIRCRNFIGNFPSTMAFLEKQVLCFLILIAVLCQQVTSDCGGTCYTTPVWPEPDHTFRRKHLRGFSYKNLTADVKTCYSSCAQDCRCKACQMQGTRCELLDEDKSSMPEHFVDAPEYVYYEIEQVITNKKCHLLPPNACYNGCCQNQLCLNGGTCTERCLSPKEKFTCKCPRGYIGKLCETKHITSCMDVLVTSKSFPEDGVYSLVRSDNNFILAYCSFEENPTRAWTLIESFAFEKANEFKYKPFYVNYPINNDNPPSWEYFRMGSPSIEYIRSKYTLFRATCDFPRRRGLLTPDLLIGRISDVDILTFHNAYYECKKYNFIDIRRHNCTDCTALTFQYYYWHFHIDVTHNACQFRPPHTVDHVDSFGAYFVTEPESKCTATPNSTTQWWLGEEKWK